MSVNVDREHKFFVGDKVRWRRSIFSTKPMMVVRYEIDEHGIHIVHVWNYMNRPANYLTVWVGELVAIS